MVVVTATTGREDALRAMAEAQRAWNELSDLADHWTAVHRRRDFGLGQVVVFLDGEMPRVAGAPPLRLAPQSDSMLIYLNLSSAGAPLHLQADALRGAIALSFLHLAQFDRDLPEWFCTGLAAYIAERTRATPEKGRPPTVADAVGAAEPIRRTTAAAPADEAWIRYLIEGDDAQHAALLFDAVRETIRRGEGRDHQRQYTLRGRNQVASFNSPRPQTPVDRLRMELAQSSRFAAWQADPLVDQPQFDPRLLEPEAELRERQQAMLIILKLSRRFAVEPFVAVRPQITRITETGLPQTADAAPASTAPTTAEILRRITQPDRGTWATLDVDGSLLWSTDRTRLEQLFGATQGRYETAWRDGLVLRLLLPDGEALEAWLEEDAANPRRPIARFRRTGPS